jgi:hypothetical protein
MHLGKKAEVQYSDKLLYGWTITVEYENNIEMHEH